MGVFLCTDFLSDLRNHGDMGFARRVLAKFFTSNGTFREDSDDHRYHGIKDAWIRVISRGASGWRAIYIRDGSRILLYRAGEHSIEDNLLAPNASHEYVELDTAYATVDPAAAQRRHTAGVAGPFRSRLLLNTRGRLLRDFLLRRRLTPHLEIILISPKLSPECFLRTHRLGGVLESLMEEGTSITVVTRPPSTRVELQDYIGMEQRGLSVSFHPTVHANLYIFKTRDDVPAASRGAALDSTAVVGSASLTEEELGFTDPISEDLCYELPSEELESAIEYATHLLCESDDVVSARAMIHKMERQ